MSPSWTSHGPLSLQGGLAVKGAEAAAARLTVVDHPDSGAGGSAPPALVSAATAAALGGASPLLLQLSGGSDCVVCAAVDARVPDGRIALSPAAKHNLHLASGCADEWAPFSPPAGEPFDLVSLEVEVSVLGQQCESEVVLDAALLGPAFAKQWFGRVLAVNEVALLAHGGHQLLLRVTAADTLDAEAQAEQLGYHCYRGRLAPGTQLYLAASGGGSGSDSGAGSGGGGGAALAQSVVASRSRVRLINATPRPAAGPPRRACGVTTSDGEWFPVQRALLRPCIALTKVIRSDEDSPSVTVDIDTLTFDRVLIFLECLALGRPPPSFGIHLAAQLLDAGRKLGLRALEEHCEGKLEAVVSRQRRHSFAEIVHRNTAGGECLLVLDGMVLDVTRWLPEHPGGDTIIPQQALNLDCSRFFEVYHSSRESFVYLQEFYVGEVVAEDRGAVPQPEEAPSQEFMEQLRQYTAPFRMPEEDRAYKSF